MPPLWGGRRDGKASIFFSVGSLGEFGGWDLLWLYIMMHKCILRCLNI